MNVWDIAIFIMVLAQCIALVSVAVAALTLKNGPIAHFLKRGNRLVNGGKNLAGIVQTRAGRMQPIVLKIAEAGSGTVDTVRKAGTRWDILMEGPLLLTALWGRFETGRGLLRQGAGLAKRMRKRAETVSERGERVPPRLSLPERLGLIPPILKPVLRLWPYVGTVRDTFRELKERGLLTRH